MKSPKLHVNLSTEAVYPDTHVVVHKPMCCTDVPSMQVPSVPLPNITDGAKHGLGKHSKVLGTMTPSEHDKVE
jgi:hypothetical protein